ncbi:trihelix transcription factor ASR3 isoform X2 [Citrus sinensis]|uniref:trihelix transcription factor ASR3 isoform X2 n=1 Tax=Citrus sinensis TaxID=2711 RepID=UPI002279E50D|nr:trihelix transcription factor ASR3 isoform X2 [Citrus sinensis]
MTDQGGDGGGGTGMREYRKGNWTVSETMVLIEAKQMDDERRMKRSSGESSESRGKPAELRWKWVEDYCCRKGCLRSQNQCNDKWDNLMRDYKRVRDYERKLLSSSSSSSPSDHGNIKAQNVSYWKMEKNERKEKNLPTNMLPQIYEALVEVVEKKGAGQRVIAGAGVGVSVASGSHPHVGYMVQPIAAAASLPPMLQQQHHQPSAPTTMLQPQPLPLPPLSLQPPPPQPQAAVPTVDSDTSEYSDSPAKRRKRGGAEGGSGDQQGTSAGATATASASTPQELGAAISKSASIIADAIQSCEEREGRRHRDLVSLHERRLKIEESKTEINREGINGLVDAINKLANSILALASSSKNQQSASK